MVMAGSSRRGFLRQAVAGSSLFSVADFGWLGTLRPVSAEEARIDPETVQFQPDIEPLVRLIEDTPRETLLEQVAARVAAGLSYRELLAALLLAGVRNVQPRPSVGFKFHAVLVVNSAHLASLASADQDRWLPIFWAIDYFKSAQDRDVREGNWTMSAVDESAVPTADKAEGMFRQAMESWDESAVDAAVAGLARTRGMNQLFELFAHYGARDFRSIGHKAIFVANGFRTLQCIGWRYAEPVLRSLAYALLNHEGQPNPAQSDLEADRPWKHNQELADQVRPTWQQGRIDAGATEELLSSLRAQSPNDVSQLIVSQLNAGVSPQSLFDAMFLASGEMLMRQPGIVALHASTTTNAIRYAFDTSADDRTRRLLMLQNAAFLPMFRDAMHARGDVGDDRVDQLQSASVEDSEQPLNEIFLDVSRDRHAAARKLYGLLESGGSAEDAMQKARQLVFLKGNDSHDYKFSSAVLEDYYHVSPEWRNRFLAASVFKLRGSADQDNGLVQRIRSALA
jgi:hypothetical protein